MNINDTLLMYLNVAEISKKHIESTRRDNIRTLLEILNYIAIELLDYHEDKTVALNKTLHILNFNVDPMENMLLHLIIGVILLI
jgi:hypothetical protein